MFVWRGVEETERASAFLTAANRKSTERRRRCNACDVEDKPVRQDLHAMSVFSTQDETNEGESEREKRGVAGCNRV